MLQSYKIFINETPLVIANKDYDADNENYKEYEIDLEKEPEAVINDVFEGKFDSGILVRVDSVQDSVAKLRSRLTTIVAAGGLAVNTNDELLMIFRRGKWDLPKGKLDSGEDLESAAIREVMEETGVTGLTITHKATMMDYIYRDKGKIFLKEIHWYDMHCADNNILIPQTNEGITDAQWVKKGDMHEKMENTYASVRELLFLYLI